MGGLAAQLGQSAFCELFFIKMEKWGQTPAGV